MEMVELSDKKLCNIRVTYLGPREGIVERCLHIHQDLETGRAHCRSDVNKAAAFMG